jgi:hypothetical protein
MIRSVTVSLILSAFTTESWFLLQSMNVIERRGFRDLLLLLRGDLKESDIPKRTKIRELIIKSWREYMEVLKAELAVSSAR